MKLSIVVPVHNMAAGDKLTFCLDALLNQKNLDGTPLTDYEIICVDDASTDESPDILRQYEAEHPDRIKVLLLTENVRQGGARNRGMEVASGEWIGFMDSDDWPAETMYASLLERGEKKGADVVGCEYQLVKEHGFPEGIPTGNNCFEQSGLLTKEKIRKLILAPGSMVIKIYQTEVIREKKLSFPEKMLYEDNAEGPIWMASFSHFEYLEIPFYYYYQHDASTVHVVTKSRLRDRLKAGRIMMQEAKKRKMLKAFQPEFEAQYLQTAFANTLFSYAINTKWMNPFFLKEMQKEIKQFVPNFSKNSYYGELFDKEQRKLMELFGNSVFLFWVYDTLLMTYRRIRKGKG